MLAELKRIAQEIWPFVAGVLVGLAIGGVWTLLQPDRYRAETHVILRGGSALRLAPAVSTLANGGVVQENVKQTLRLSSTPDLSARVDRNILVITAEAGSRERARQVDAEAAQVTTQLVAARFGSEDLQASLLDPAHVTDQTSPTAGRNLFIGALLGLVAGGGIAYLRSRRLDPTSAPAGVVDPNVERRLKRRIDEVTKRERGLARRAGELAARERAGEQRAKELEARERTAKQHEAKLSERESSLAERRAALEPEGAQVPGQRAMPPSRPAEEPEPAVRSQPGVPAGAWTLEELERIAHERRDAFPDRAEEWETYLYLLREHATIGGSLPRAFDPLIADVFGDALDRSRGDSTA